MNQKKTILLLIDDFSTKILTSISLRMENFDVIEATNADNAMNAVMNKNANLIILSPSKKDKDGLESLKLLRSSTDLRFTPVLILADENQSSMQMDWKEAGANAWLTKPFSHAQLMRIIKMVVF